MNPLKFVDYRRIFAAFTSVPLHFNWRSLKAPYVVVACSRGWSAV